MYRRASVTTTFVVFLLSLFAISSAAQQTGASAALRGRVVDPQKRGVAAHVQVL